ncbi:MAG: hypothetical protein WA144_13455 [Candidatus Methanoperedens sp.]
MWAVILIYIIITDKLFFLLLKEFVKEEVEKGEHNEILTEIITHLIEVKNDAKNKITNDELKNIYKGNSQSLSRLQFKKNECILDLVKKEYFEN